MRKDLKRMVEIGAITKETAEIVQADIDLAKRRHHGAVCVGCGKRAQTLDNLCGSCATLKCVDYHRFWQLYTDNKAVIGIDLDTIRSVVGDKTVEVPSSPTAAGHLEVSHGE
mgnify:CR=1 FL=1